MRYVLLAAVAVGALAAFRPAAPQAAADGALCARLKAGAKDDLDNRAGAAGRDLMDAIQKFGASPTPVARVALAEAIRESERIQARREVRDVLTQLCK